MQPLPIFSSESIILSLGLHKQTIPIIAINPFYFQIASGVVTQWVSSLMLLKKNLSA